MKNKAILKKYYSGKIDNQNLPVNYEAVKSRAGALNSGNKKKRAALILELVTDFFLVFFSLFLMIGYKNTDFPLEKNISLLINRYSTQEKLIKADKKIKNFFIENHDFLINDHGLSLITGKYRK